MKKILGIILLIIIVGVIWFVRATRPVAQPTADNNVETAVEHTTTAAGTTYHISQTDSKAQFSLSEDLRGKKTLVVGVTNQVAGDIILHAEGLSPIGIGEIKVDARTLKTDDEKRNGAIARMILKTEEPGNEYITFVPTKINGLPDVLETGKEYSYTIDGNLTIRGITKPATFNAKTTIKDASTIIGAADTTVTYGDYGITVPDLPFLANIEKTTKLSISLVAKAN